ncbi:MAG TPA: hypothetical protein VE270_02570 [Thermoleophilaceae bacterium]|nr:hypothetical protein [Thermoleophilaceae bacterium]
MDGVDPQAHRRAQPHRQTAHPIGRLGDLLACAYAKQRTTADKLA